MHRDVPLQGLGEAREVGRFEGAQPGSCGAVESCSSNVKASDRAANTGNACCSLAGTGSKMPRPHARAGC